MFYKQLHTIQAANFASEKGPMPEDVQQPAWLTTDRTQANQPWAAGILYTSISVQGSSILAYPKPKVIPEAVKRHGPDPSHCHFLILAPPFPPSTPVVLRVRVATLLVLKNEKNSAPDLLSCLHLGRVR